ncbi:MAG: hypothetical protein KJ645_04555, partial [Planctomycetes bacterium]|nr:hypothetical protein [Planctomycetota bacterium]
MLNNFSNPSRCTNGKYFLVQCLVAVFLSQAWFSVRAEEANFPADPSIMHKAAKANLPFVLNRGQYPEEVQFYARTFSGTVFVTRQQEIVYSVLNPQTAGAPRGWALKEVLIDAAGHPVTGSDRTPAKVSVFHGKDPDRWVSASPVYSGLAFGEVYEGVSLCLKAYGNNIEKLFHLKPGVDPALIQMEIQGSRGLKINPNGELEVMTGSDSIRFTRPVAWQIEDDGEKSFVDVRYNVIGNRYGFEVENHDRNLELVIDPLLSSTYLGGNIIDKAGAIAVGNDGSVYVAGYVQSEDYPTTPGAYDQHYAGGLYDAFVSKFDSDLSTLEASTFLGSSGDEGWYYIGLALANDGSVYVTGNCSAADFPVTAGVFDDSYNGGPANGPYGTGGDLFVSKLSGDLTTLSASTFLGGSGLEYSRSIRIDPSGKVYIAGATSSSDFPATAGAYCETLNPGGQWNMDLCAAVLDSDLSTLHAATYLGGNGDDFSEISGLDGEGNLCITGWTNAHDFPTTPGAFETVYNGGFYDAFVSKLSADLASLSASTYLGGSNWDFAYCLDIDPAGNIFVAGHHASNNYPVTPGAYDETYNGSGGAGKGDDVFVTRFSNDLSTVSASTHLGGVRWENATSLKVNALGDVFVLGSTSSTNFPTTPCAYDRSYNGGVKTMGDFFISRFDGDLTSLIASTYFGGTLNDGGYSAALALGPNHTIYIAGETTCTDFPMTPGSFDDTYNGDGSDAVVARLDAGLSADPSLHADTSELSATTGGVV